MKRSNKILWGALGATFAATLATGLCQGRGLPELTQQEITGNGHMITQTNTLPLVKKICVNGNFDVTITQGNTNQLTLTADRNMLPYITVHSDNNIVDIGVKPGFSLSSAQPIKAVLTENTINNVVTNGRTNLHMDHINADTLTLIMNGRGTGNIAGTIKNLQLGLMGRTNLAVSVNHNNSISLTANGRTTANLTGSTNQLTITTAGRVVIDAKNLTATNANIMEMGKAHVTVHVTSHLTINSMGSSSIQYYGHPTIIEKHGFGNSTIQQMD